jgi:hypothetical protein
MLAALTSLGFDATRSENIVRFRAFPGTVGRGSWDPLGAVSSGKFRIERAGAVQVHGQIRFTWFASLLAIFGGIAAVVVFPYGMIMTTLVVIYYALWVRAGVARVHSICRKVLDACEAGKRYPVVA